MTTLMRVLLVGLWLIPPLSADAADPWIGQKVFRKEGAQPKLGDRPVDPQLIFFPATVTDVNGEWLWVGRAWIRKSDVRTIEQAFDYYSDEIRRQPSARAYLARGIIWKEKKEFDNAIKDITEAIRLSPDTYAYSNRGNAFRAKGEYHKAIQDFTEAIRLDTRDATTYRNRSLAYRDIGEYNKAIQDCTEAIRLDPEYANAYNSRGWDFYKIGEYEKALADLTDTLRIDPKHAMALGDLAWLKATCPDARYRDGKRAVEQATTACELTAWKNWDPLGALAAAYAESGDFDAAVKWQTKSIDVMPTSTSEKYRKEAQSNLELYRQKMPYRAEPEASANQPGGNSR